MTKKDDTLHLIPVSELGNSECSQKPLGFRTVMDRLQASAV